MDKLKYLLSAYNLTQASTIKAFLQMGSAAGIFHLAPQVTDQAAQSIAYLFMALQLALGVVNFYHNDRKVVVVAPSATAVYTPANTPVKPII